MSDIIYLDENDKSIVKKHIIHRVPFLIQSDYQAVSGIGSFINEEDVQAFADACIKSAAFEDDAQVINKIFREYTNMKDDIKAMFSDRLDTWVPRSSGRHALSDAAAQIKQAIMEDLPF